MRPQMSPSLNARGSPRVPKWKERPRIARSPWTQPTTPSSRRRRGARQTPRARHATQVEAARGGTHPSPRQLVLGFRAARPSQGRRIYAKRPTKLAPASRILSRLPPREVFRPARPRVLPPPRARRPPRATRLLLCATRLQGRGRVRHPQGVREARPREARAVSPVPSEPRVFSATASRRPRSNTRRCRPATARPARFLRPRPPRHDRCPSSASLRPTSRLTHRSRPRPCPSHPSRPARALPGCPTRVREWWVPRAETPVATPRLRALRRGSPPTDLESREAPLRLERCPPRAKPLEMR